MTGRIRWSSTGGILALLLVVPTLFVLVTEEISRLRGPFWLGTNSDPSYVYLVNSLALSEGEAPRHVDHPGTTLQLFGAGWLRLLTCRSLQDADCAARVFDRSEDLLRHWVLAQRILIAVVFWAGGVIVWFVTGTRLWAVVYQAVPLSCASALFESVYFKPDPWTLLLSGLLGAGLIFLGSREAERRRGWVVGIGALSAALVVTKVTAFLVPVFVVTEPGVWRRRRVFVPAFLVCTLVFLIPVLGVLPDLVGFAWRSATGTGAYGRGETARLALSGWFSNLGRLVGEEPAYAFVVAGSLVLATIGWIRSERAEARQASRRLLILASFQVMQLLMVAKQPRVRYLLPMVGLLGVNALLGWSTLRLLQPRARAGAALAAVLGIVLVSSLAVRWRVETARLARFREAALAAGDSEQRTAAGGTVLDLYGTSSKAFALWMGASYFEPRYAEPLKATYPGFLTVNTRRRELKNFDGVVREPGLRKLGESFFARGRVPVRPEVSDQMDLAFRALGLRLRNGESWLRPQGCRIECLYSLVPEDGEEQVTD